MKVLLFQAEIPRELLIAYLEIKEIPYFLYEYQQNEREYLKVQHFSAKLYEREDYISLVDKGDSYPSERNNGYWTEGAYQPNIQSLRYDKDMIRLVEKRMEQLGDIIQVVEIPPGARYRFVLDILETSESIEIFEGFDWLCA